MYTIQVLEDKQFDQLPYKYVRESLGCADPKTKTAYVRNTHWGEISKTVTLLTIQHELDELLAKVSPHEEDGIRYKKGRTWISRFLSPILGAILAPFTGGLSILGSGLLSGGLQGREVQKGNAPWWSIPVSGGTAALGAYGGSQAISGFMSPGATASTSMGEVLVKPTLMQSITGAAKSVLGTGAIGNISGGTPVGGTPVGGTVLSTGAGPATGMINLPRGTPTGISLLEKAGTSAINVGQSPGLQQVAGQAIKTTGASKTLLSALDNPLVKLGLGSMGLSALPISITTPNLGEITSKWLTADTVTAAGAAAKKIADVQYAGEFQVSKETQAYSDVMEKDIRKAYAQRRKDLDKMGLAISEQFMSSGERLTMLENITEQEQEEVDRMKAEWISQAKTLHATQQYNYVMDQMNIDDQTKRELLYADLNEVMLKYQLQEADIMNFRKIAADAGLYLTAKGLGIA